MRGDELAAHLARSKDTGLTIVLYDPLGEDERFSWFVTTVAEHGHRWSKLEFRSRTGFWEVYHDFSLGIRLYEKLRNMDVSRLTSLSMRFFYILDTGVEDESSMAYDSTRFYTTWKLPCLKRLVITKLVQLPTSFEGITTLHVLLPGDDYHHSFNKLILMLSSTPRLEELLMVVNAILVREDHMPRVVNLEHLRRFHIVCMETAFEDSPEVIEQLLATLYMPKLTTYTCGMSTTVPLLQLFPPSSPDPNPGYTLTFFPTSGALRSVKELHIHKGYQYQLPLPLYTILSRTPSIQTLRITEMDLTEGVLADNALTEHLPPLCWAWFDRCGVTWEFLRRLVEALKRRTPEMVFPRFYFRGCYGVKREEVIDILPPGVLDWTDMSDS